MSAPNSAVLDMAVAKGFETKPLVYGVRIVGTDIVCSDTPWKGLYLCKSNDFTEADRCSLGQAKLMPADKGCWRVAVESLATDAEEAKAQAEDMLRLAAKKGYGEKLAEGLAEVEEVAAEATAEEAIEASPEEPSAEASPKSRAGRRKKQRKQEAALAPEEVAAPPSDLDADLASL